MSNGPSNGFRNGENRLSRAGACAQPVPSRPVLALRDVELGPFAREATADA
jgi:hypothetical protein